MKKIFGWFAALLIVLFLAGPVLAAEDDFTTRPFECYVTELGPDSMVIVSRTGKEAELPNITNLEDHWDFLALAMRNHWLICLLAKFSHEGYDFHVEISMCD